MVHHLSGALILLQVYGDLSLLYGNHPVLFQLLDGAVQGLYGDTALLVKLLPGLFDDESHLSFFENASYDRMSVLRNVTQKTYTKE